MDSLRGQLLVAGPALLDPNFRRTVVLVCEHSEHGALGLVLNRPTPLVAHDEVPELAPLLLAGETLWTGGPVQSTHVVLLAELAEPAPEAALMITGTLGLVTDGGAVTDLIDPGRRARAFLGYAGWGGGQLEAELDGDDWLVAPLAAGDPFTKDATSLWAGALRRKGGRFALLATLPLDPTLN